MVHAMNNDLWSHAHSQAAIREGWDVFECSGSSNGAWQIQRIDSPEDVVGFDVEIPLLLNDEAAWRIVCEGTAPHHIAAREFIRSENPAEFYAMQRLCSSVASTR